MDLSKYIQAGYTILFIETTEIKRAIRSIKENLNENFKSIIWNMLDGIISDNTSVAQMDAMAIVSKLNDPQQLVEWVKTLIIAENFDWFIENIAISQGLLNATGNLQTQQTCICIVGTDSSKIPAILKEVIPVINFDLPNKKEVREIAMEIQESSKEAINQKIEEEKENKAKITKEYNTNLDEKIFDALQGLSKEEIQNVLSLSFVDKHCFDLDTILTRKRQVIKRTGFMDFIHPEPVENLGGLDNLKKYINKRITAFEPGSKKPKLRSILFVGFPGTGKTLAAKVLISLMNVPGIILDVGALKGGLVGQTEQNTRHATKLIDAFGRCVVVIDEIEKAFAGSTGKNLDSGVSAGILGHFLTWMQERESEGVLVATSNDLSKLPPEFLRAGRWDAIFFVDMPNAKEVVEIINIMNKRYSSDLSTDKEFVTRLTSEGWTGAEIEQLAKDSHFDEIDTCINEIPILTRTKGDSIEQIRKQAKQFRSANREKSLLRNKMVNSKRKLSIRNTGKLNPALN